MWVKGESSCQQFLDPSDDLWWRCRILNNGRRSAFVIDKRCVQDKGNCSCLKLPAKVTAVTAKDGGCKVGTVGQSGWEFLASTACTPFDRSVRLTQVRRRRALQQVKPPLDRSCVRWLRGAKMLKDPCRHFLWDRTVLRHAVGRGEQSQLNHSFTDILANWRGRGTWQAKPMKRSSGAISDIPSFFPYSRETVDIATAQKQNNNAHRCQCLC